MQWDKKKVSRCLSEQVALMLVIYERLAESFSFKIENINLEFIFGILMLSKKCSNKKR